ncbi:Crp/Fnr family transcriptional regulator [Flavobacterium procerum]|uniref:Crp/Fnr family transcriptional regulator n=1 Tax=Flavobacterium procerum TaxID=1455569 RepID=A0ABV6BM12_9FLAO
MNSKTHAFKKNTLITRSGAAEDYLSFIETGIVRFWIEAADKEITFDFAFEKSFFSAHLSFFIRESTDWNIQSVAPTVLWRISCTDLQLIYQQAQVGDKLGRLAARIYLFRLPEEKFLF